MKKLIALSACAAFAAFPLNAMAGEYEAAWQDTDQCYDQYAQTLAGLPSVTTTPLSDLLAVYDKHSNETLCTVTFGVTEGHLESLGYFTIIDYRDDLYRRKQRYTAILDIYANWKTSVRANRPDFNAALKARVDAKAKPYDLHEARMKWLRRNSDKSGTDK